MKIVANSIAPSAAGQAATALVRSFTMEGTKHVLAAATSVSSGGPVLQDIRYDLALKEKPTQAKRWDAYTVAQVAAAPMTQAQTAARQHANCMLPIVFQTHLPDILHPLLCHPADWDVEAHYGNCGNLPVLQGVRW